MWRLNRHNSHYDGLTVTITHILEFTFFTLWISLHRDCDLSPLLILLCTNSFWNSGHHTSLTPRVTDIESWWVFPISSPEEISPSRKWEVERGHGLGAGSLVMFGNRFLVFNASSTLIRQDVVIVLNHALTATPDFRCNVHDMLTKYHYDGWFLSVFQHDDKQ